MAEGLEIVSVGMGWKWAAELGYPSGPQRRGWSARAEYRIVFIPGSLPHNDDCRPFQRPLWLQIQLGGRQSTREIGGQCLCNAARRLSGPDGRMDDNISALRGRNYCNDLLASVSR